jgi:hypothetical protein
MLGVPSCDTGRNTMLELLALAASDIGEDCTWNGIPLYGEVQVVESFADIDVEVVTNFPDLNVKVVESFPDDCGEWEFVESFPDFTIRFVDSFADIRIEFVESFPGVE